MQIFILFVTCCYFMNKVEPPQSFSFEGNVCQGLKIWLKHIELSLTDTEKDRKNDKVKGIA